MWEINGIFYCVQITSMFGQKSYDVIFLIEIITKSSSDSEVPQLQCRSWTRPFPPLRGCAPAPRAQWYAPRCLPSAPTPAATLSSLPAPSLLPHCALAPLLSATHPRTALHPDPRPAMKQPLADLMRMSRICRMVLATCLGSFILVIFYFQSMFQPGRTSLFLLLLRVCLQPDAVFGPLWTAANI